MISATNTQPALVFLATSPLFLLTSALAATPRTPIAPVERVGGNGTLVALHTEE